MELSIGTIGWAVCEMQAGMKVARRGWNGKGMWIALCLPHDGVGPTEPYVIMKNAQGGTIPWLCSQGDLLAEDWEHAE